jgi:hypothetical protein
MTFLVTAFNGSSVLFCKLEEAYEDIVRRIGAPDRWHRMLLHHVRDLLLEHKTPAHTRLIVKVAFTDDESEWYEIQEITAAQQRQQQLLGPSLQQSDQDTRSSPAT